MMDPGGIAVASSADDALPQIRDLPQLPSLQITPLRQLVSSRGLNVPLPFEPKAGAVHETTISKPSSSSGALPAKLPTLEEFLNAARANTFTDSSVESISSLEPPPKTILPAFINLRAVEKLPYASFDEEGPRKRRRLDVQNTEHFGEHLQLPIPHSQSEKKPPPFGPFAILNGLNEPPPNAALFPPIEPGSIAQILTKPTKDSPAGEAESLSFDKGTDNQCGERREGRLEEILDSQLETQDEAREIGKDAKTEGTAQDEVIPPPTDNDTRHASFGGGQKSAGDSDEHMSSKTRGRSRKKLRKWTEEETNDLLKGVVKCGIGNWTAILAQPELKFNKRTAANLKDRYGFNGIIVQLPSLNVVGRFRVCCPWAYG
jgi:Myb-like DNA-binding domain